MKLDEELCYKFLAENVQLYLAHMPSNKHSRLEAAILSSISDFCLHCTLSGILTHLNSHGYRKPSIKMINKNFNLKILLSADKQFSNSNHKRYHIQLNLNN